MSLSLSAYYKFVIRNDTGEAINATNITLRFRKEKFGTDGSLTLSSEATVSGDNSSLADGAYDDLGSSIDNTGSSDKYLGISGTLECNLSGESAPNGPISLWIKMSSDNSNWPDDGDGILIGVVEFTGSAADKHGQVSF